MEDIAVQYITDTVHGAMRAAAARSAAAGRCAGIAGYNAQPVSLMYIRIPLPGLSLQNAYDMTMTASNNIRPGTWLMPRGIVN